MHCVTLEQNLWGDSNRHAKHKYKPLAGLLSNTTRYINLHRELLHGTCLWVVVCYQAHLNFSLFKGTKIFVFFEWLILLQHTGEGCQLREKESNTKTLPFLCLPATPVLATVDWSTVREVKVVHMRRSLHGHCQTPFFSSITAHVSGYTVCTQSNKCYIGTEEKHKREHEVSVGNSLTVTVYSSSCIWNY